MLLADDHRVVREGLRSLLQSQPDVEVVGEAADGVRHGNGVPAEQLLAVQALELKSAGPARR